MLQVKAISFHHDAAGTRQWNLTVAASTRPAVTPREYGWAVQKGICGSGSRVVIGGVSLPDQLAEDDAYPVVWLPDQKLVVAALPDGCEQAAEIWLIDVNFQGPSSATLLVHDVDAAAVRAAVPAPPSALGDVDLDEFA